jgi:hypothetical protein
MQVSVQGDVATSAAAATPPTQVSSRRSAKSTVTGSGSDDDDADADDAPRPAKNKNAPEPKALLREAVLLMPRDAGGLIILYSVMTELGASQLFGTTQFKVMVGWVMYWHYVNDCHRTDLFPMSRGDIRKALVRCVHWCSPELTACNLLPLTNSP